MDTGATPHINSARLGSFAGRTVRVIGKVERVEGNVVMLKSSDEGLIEVSIANLGEHDWPNLQYVEIIGKVSKSGDVLQEFSTIEMTGPELDMKLVDRLVAFEEKLPDVFGRAS
ncbi:replication factor A protein 3 [Tilletiaria anomala UBC 951]|uniref:Replication factor A protein 3 n=1 Tax=Tilletiaria anomala (strain ATCC 24038 / CBS 436.72 / UBC 951) TaxID=1037660 RepID=A0A066WNP4_TILAU|nr:replication factor A protein 3 [Tilletiaria anomala UBC 951]KDN52235.1 replication factor A protein 3 [Tilletiaria anomala UBC 951]